MSTRDGRIIDLRYYDGTDVGSNSYTGLVAGVFRSLKFAAWVGDRICRKSREYGLRLGSRDHVYLVVRPEPPFGEVRRGAREKWTAEFCQPIEGHLDPALLEAQGEVEREDALADLTFRALEVAVDHDAAQLALLARVRADLAAERRDLGVLWIEHETKGYRARVLHHLNPLVQGPLTMLYPAAALHAVIWYEDRVTGFLGRARLGDYGSYDQLHAAVGSVSRRGDRLVVKPHRGYAFEPTIEVPIADLTPVA